MGEDRSYIRKAELADKELLLTWANDEDVRKNSFHRNSIAYEEHEKWFLNKLNDKNCLLYIYICDNIPVGQIRLDVEGEQGWINYSIAKEYRYRGHGENMLVLLVEALKKENSSIKFLCAKVLKSNSASQKKFEQQNYQRFERANYVEYEKVF